ncbi:MAG: hypothetical protein ACO1O1_12375 [Adhaeribacter sp.]
MPSFLSILKFPCFFLLFFACLLTSPAVRAQQERVLQQVDLRLPGNRPLMANPYLLPALVAQGIEAGKITPYRIDYEANSLSPLSLAQYHKHLEFVNTGDFLSIEDDTLEVMPWNLYLLALDVTKEKGKLKKINYLHFSSMETQAGLVKYHYSVSFPQLAAYLQEVKALWIKNSSPFVWRNQVLHAYNEHPVNVLPEEEATFSVHLTEKPKGTYSHLELYSRDQKLVKRIPYQDLWPANDSSDIRWMDEALRAGLYQVGLVTPDEGEETERKLSTTLPEAPQVVSSKPAPVAFSIIQTDLIHTLRPENKTLKTWETGLRTSLDQAIGQGRLPNLYTSADLSERMTAADWQKHSQENGEMPAGSTSPNSKIHYAPLIAVSWKIFFNDKGEITGRQPLALGFLADSSSTASGFHQPIGFIPFEEAVKTLKEKPAARLLTQLRRRKYFAFWDGSSAITAEAPSTGKRSQAK